MTWCVDAAAFEGFGRRLPKAPPCSCTGFQTRSQLWGQHEHRLSRLLKRAEKHFNYWLNLAGHLLKTGFLYILSCSSTRSSFLILIFFFYTASIFDSTIVRTRTAHSPKFFSEILRWAIQYNFWSLFYDHWSVEYLWSWERRFFLSLELKKNATMNYNPQNLQLIIVCSNHLNLIIFEHSKVFRNNFRTLKVFPLWLSNFLRFFACFYIFVIINAALTDDKKRRSILSQRWLGPKYSIHT